MNILLVDDNLLMQQVIVRFLGSLGYKVSVAGSAGEAVRLAHLSPPALFLIDLHLPDQDGPGTLRALRALPGCAGTPAIGISGLDEYDARYVLTPDFAAYLAKPVDLDLLAATVHTYLDSPAERIIG